MSLLGAALIALQCTPALPHFCANIHVGCAGKSTLATSGFVATQTEVVFADRTIWPVRLHEDARATVYHRIASKDWIRIQKNGLFSQRIYRKGRALMTRGRCRSAVSPAGLAPPYVPAATR